MRTIREGIAQAKVDWRADRMKLPDLDGGEAHPDTVRSGGEGESDVLGDVLSAQ